MALSLAEQQRAAKEFFAAETKNLSSATRAVIRTTAKALKTRLQAQLRTFKASPGSTFRRALKVYDLDPSGALGPASFVRLGIAFMDAFEEGKTIQGNPSLIVLLPDGARLGFKRISKGNTWNQVWTRISKRSKLAKTSTGVVVLFNQEGQNYPIYKFVKRVTVPKKIQFYATAEALANLMPKEIEKLLEQTHEQKI